MTPEPIGPGSVRSSAAVNEDIRALWVDPRVGLTGAQRAKYERLVAEWAAAVRAEVVKAA